MATDQETRDRAEELYVLNGLTQEEVAEQTGVPVGTINRWSGKGNWKFKRREFREAESEIKRYSRQTRLKLIKDAMTSLDPQKIYAFATLERAVQGRKGDFSENEANYSEVEIKTPQEAILALQEAVSRKLNLMLARPDVISLSGIKDMQKALELIETMKEKYQVEPEETRIEGYDEDQARFWREKVLKGR